MNLKEEITSYLDSHDYDDFTKIRWIYLYVCSIFSYDTKYIFANNSLKKRIYTKKTDIMNVKEFEIVCYAISKVIIDVLELYKMDATLVREVGMENTHVYVVVEYNGKLVKLDPMIQHDTSRIKMGLKTLNFQPQEEDTTFMDRLKETDEIIGYPYNINNIPESFDNILNDLELNGLSREGSFIKKLNTIFDLVNKADTLTRYDDIDYYMGYLIKKTHINDPVAYVKPAVFYKVKEDGKWDIINLILVEYPGLPVMFYKMTNETGKYLVTEINNSELMYYLDEYDSIVEYYFRSRAEKIKRL